MYFPVRNLREGEILDASFRPGEGEKTYEQLHSFPLEPTIYAGSYVLRLLRE